MGIESVELPQDAATDAGAICPDDRRPDDQALMRHHPLIGYQYVPGICLTQRRPDGSPFELRVNAAGFRSDREYSRSKPPGVYRILVLGDSMSDGLYQSNACRFTEIIEQRNRGIEVLNFSLPGSGTDHQLLIYEEIARHYEHDLVVLLPFLMNIRRIQSWTIASLQRATGQVIYRQKPRFVLESGKDGHGTLVLRNVPIPEPQPAPATDVVDPRKPGRTESMLNRLRRARRNLSPAKLIKRCVYPVLEFVHLDPYPLLDKIGIDPFPEYRDADTEEWRLMEAILRRFAASAADRPFVIAPLVNSSFVKFRLPRHYMNRFAALADGRRVFVIDVLPRFRALGREAVCCFHEPLDPHFSDLGHRVLADALECELRARALLP
jgi:hypothetical protein